LVYIPSALLLLGVFGGFYVYADYRRIPELLAVKWMNISTTALFVFGVTVKKFWQHRKRWTFWVELCVLLSAHFIILERLQWQKGSYFWLILVLGIPEMFVIFNVNLNSRTSGLTIESSTTPMQSRWRMIASQARSFGHLVSAVC